MVQQFTVYGTPVGKQRARVTTRGGFARAYTPEKTRTYEADIRKAYMDAYGNLNPSNKPISMTIDARFEPPESWSGKKKKQCIGGEIPKTTKPDLDNVLKSINDALNGLAYKDDSQIISVSADKRYGEESKVIVTIREVDGCETKE